MVYTITVYFSCIGSSSSSSKNVLDSLWSIVVHGELYKVAMRNAQVLQKLFKTIYSVWLDQLLSSLPLNASRLGAEAVCSGRVFHRRTGEGKKECLR